MFERYPHKATIHINTETTSDEGIISVVPDEIAINGRYEPNNASKNIDYSGSFFSPRNDLKSFNIDGQTLIFEDMSFKIVQLFNYQTHCKIWLE